jgi:hypothetical protein
VCEMSSGRSGMIPMIVGYSRFLLTGFRWLADKSK